MREDSQLGRERGYGLHRSTFSTKNKGRNPLLPRSHVIIALKNLQNTRKKPLHLTDPPCDISCDFRLHICIFDRRNCTSKTKEKPVNTTFSRIYGRSLLPALRGTRTPAFCKNVTYSVRSPDSLSHTAKQKSTPRRTCFKMPALRGTRT